MAEVPLVPGELLVRAGRRPVSTPGLPCPDPVQQGRYLQQEKCADGEGTHQWPAHDVSPDCLHRVTAEADQENEPEQEPAHGNLRLWTEGRGSHLASRAVLPASRQV